MSKMLYRFIPPAAGLLFLLTIWHLAVVLGDISPVILPLPVDVARELIENRVGLVKHSMLTLAEAATGFALAIFVGVMGAVIFILFPKLSDSFYPWVVALKMVPMIALAPLIVVWFGTGFGSKIAMAATVAFFPVLVNALRGLRSVGTDLNDLFETLAATKWQILWKLRLPSAIGYTFAALRISAVFAVIGAVVAEFVGANAGIGYFVKAASYYSETDRMMAGIVATAGVGAVLYGAVILVERLSPRWRWATGHERDV